MNEAYTIPKWIVDALLEDLKGLKKATETGISKINERITGLEQRLKTLEAERVK